MCGIAGLLHFDSDHQVDEGIVKRMTDVLEHRGPDGCGSITLGSIGLGHRRLSIIDIESGSQPMVSSDQQLTLIYNGELYNYIEIKQELLALGRVFLTQSDTEVVLQAYDEWGTKCLDRFNGMWAFALWDARKRSLFCARDRLGEKPFYYAVNNGSFYFGSEIKALIEGGVPRVINEEMLDALLCMGYLPAPYTFFKGINKLPAGCFLLVQDKNVRVQRYWQYPSRPLKELRTDSELIDKEFEYLFDDSVRLRMRSDVTVGAFLSGGLDSGSVVSAMCKSTNEQVQTCTIGFETESDELKLARLVARHFETNHVERIVGANNVPGLVEKVAWHFDEPFGDTSILPTYIVSRLAREFVTVALTGDGGDEVLGGYPAHQSEKIVGLWQHLPISISRPMLSMAMTTAIHLNRSRRILRFLETAGDDFTKRLIAKQVGFNEQERHSLLGNNPRIRPAREFIDEAMTGVQTADGNGLLNYWLHTVALPERYLCKVDRCSMAHSLETRVPFLDVRIVELLASVSPRVKMPWLTRKAVLRRTIGERLPAALLRSGKRGFDPPIQKWFSVKEVMTSETRKSLVSSGLFFDSGLRKLCEQNTNTFSPMGLWSMVMLGKQEHLSSKNIGKC